MPNPGPEKNSFHREITYPDAQGLISWVPKTLEEVKATSFVVLDTNTLLVPYTLGKTSLDDIAKIYRALVAADRLIVPGQVIREFASNRVVKLKDLHQQLTGKRNKPSVTASSYPLLDGLAELSGLVAAEKKLQAAIHDYTDAIDEVLIRVRNFYWNDPVTILYSELFAKGVVEDPTLDKNKLKEDLAKRIELKIPPGYKDAAKDDGGMGDLIIWYTILRAGEVRKASAIFVSADQKADWWSQSEGAALYPRFELVDEYRRHSEGGSFHIVTLSTFLDLMGTSKTSVNEVRREEQVSSHQEDAEAYAGMHDDSPTYAWKKVYWNLLQERVYGDLYLVRTDEIDHVMAVARDELFRAKNADDAKAVQSRAMAILDVLLPPAKKAWYDRQSSTS